MYDDQGPGYQGHSLLTPKTAFAPPETVENEHNWQWALLSTTRRTTVNLIYFSMRLLPSYITSFHDEYDELLWPVFVLCKWSHTRFDGH